LRPARARIALTVLDPRCIRRVRRLVHDGDARYAPRGPLQPLGVGDQQILANLKAHVAAVASEEHNTGHPEALERSARYIEATLSGLGYAVSRRNSKRGA